MPLSPLSIIIPTLNEEHYLPTLLESLLPCSEPPLEVIVVDGRSDDGTLAVVERFQRAAPPTLTFRSLTSDRRNVAHQRNLGAADAVNDTLLFLDADTVIPTPQHLRDLLARFQRHDHVAATCRFAPVEPDWRASAYFCLLYAFHKAMARRNPYALGACLLTTKTVFTRVGGFDPGIRLNEDANYCLRAIRYGSFGILPTTLKVSIRRFAKHGYLRMGLRYLRIFYERTVRGEIHDDRIPYEFGRFG